MKPRVVGFVQARMSSTRLPGKVMLDILGKPMVWHIFKRVAAAKKLDETVLVISTNPNDKPMIEMAEKEGLPYFAGDEADLLNRYMGAAKKFKADAIVRVTADCPFADPFLINEIVDYFQKNPGLDYISNSRPVATYPHGLDVELFTFKALEKAYKEITDPFRREWLTTNFFEHPEIYKNKNLTNDKDLTNYRLTVDYQEDLDLTREIYKALYPKNAVFTLKDIIAFLEMNPNIAKINEMHLKRDQYKEMTKKGVA